MGYKDPEKRKQKDKERYEKNKEKRKEYNVKRYEQNKEQIKETTTKRLEDRKQHAVDSITSGRIIDKKKWDMWCDKIKRYAQKYPYSEDFTNDMMFNKMVEGCYYCGDIATTIDRIDSKLDHTIENCIGCCHGCNTSKGVADFSTFIRKAWYRVRDEYYDDDIDIWFVNKNKPSLWDYKRRAKKQGVSFDLTKEDFEDLTKGVCEYCNRTPTTWFGIDRVIPSLGYVHGNVVSCCYDCNLDKLEDDIVTMLKRNGRIANRVDIGEIVIDPRKKVILHKGTHPYSKKVCVRGHVYASMNDASSAFGKGINYVKNCIREGRYQDDIFEISDEFYEEYKDSENITKTMFIGFDHYYTNM